jgi:hypothetical protein
MLFFDLAVEYASHLAPCFWAPNLLACGSPEFLPVNLFNSSEDSIGLRLTPLMISLFTNET